MAVPHQCLEEAELQGLIDCGLPEERQAALAEHLEVCKACRHRLEAVIGRSNLLPPPLLQDAESARRSEALEEVIRELKSTTWRVVFAPDGRRLATTGRDGKMHLWDVAKLIERGSGDPTAFSD